MGRSEGCGGGAGQASLGRSGGFDNARELGVGAAMLVRSGSIVHDGVYWSLSGFSCSRQSLTTRSMLRLEDRIPDKLNRGYAMDSAVQSAAIRPDSIFFLTKLRRDSTPCLPAHRAAPRTTNVYVDFDVSTSWVVPISSCRPGAHRALIRHFLHS